MCQHQLGCRSVWQLNSLYSHLHEISDPIYDLLASTCTDLHNEGAVLSGTYKLSLSSTIDNFYCHSGGEEMDSH
ncbi:hypothetical protein EB796_024936 [Bugula neritina]|uniref:Uncharacterized protein n=1 Tax=Bugula neritina TaxID=10212 RepID=A0A7J7ITM3_BUGNE|nr:hypothetical protein EB796_024936 [Bugula neritina]